MSEEHRRNRTTLSRSTLESGLKEVKQTTTLRNGLALLVVVMFGACLAGTVLQLRMQGARVTPSGLVVGVALFGGLLAFLVFWARMLMDISTRPESQFPHSKGNSRAMWTMVVAGLMPVGAALYYFMVKKGGGKP